MEIVSCMHLVLRKRQHMLSAWMTYLIPSAEAVPETFYSFLIKVWKNDLSCGTLKIWAVLGKSGNMSCIMEIWKRCWGNLEVWAVSWKSGNIVREIQKNGLNYRNLEIWALLKKSGNMSCVMEKVENCRIATGCLFFAVSWFSSIFEKQVVLSRWTSLPL